MKHSIIIILLMLTTTIYSQTYDLKAFYFVATNTDGVDDESDVDIDIKLDTYNKRITIFSYVTQIIDYDVLRTYDEDGYSVNDCIATDTYYNPILLKIYISKEMNRIVIFITAKKMIYCYACKLI